MKHLIFIFLIILATSTDALAKKCLEGGAVFDADENGQVQLVN